MQPWFVLLTWRKFNKLKKKWGFFEFAGKFLENVNNSLWQWYSIMKVGQERHRTFFFKASLSTHDVEMWAGGWRALQRIQGVIREWGACEFLWLITLLEKSMWRNKNWRTGQLDVCLRNFGKVQLSSPVVEV